MRSIKRFTVTRTMQALAMGVLLFIGLGAAWAGEESTTTPAPSKTPTPTVQAITPTAEADAESTAGGVFKSFTQQDLQVITGNVLRPNGISWYDNKLYIVCNGDWTIYEVDDTTGATRTYIYGVRNSHTLITETNDNAGLTIWAPDFDQDLLLNVEAIRSPQPLSTSLDGPWGIARLDDAHFVITNLGDNTLVQISRDGESAVIAEGFRSPTGVAVQDDVVYVANNGSARRAIEWLSLEEESPTPKPLITGLQSTTSLVLAPDGYLYFAYALGTRGVVGRVDPVVCQEQGGCTNDQIDVVLFTELAAPLAGLTITPDLRLFVHTMFRPEIYWVRLPDANLTQPDTTREDSSG